MTNDWRRGEAGFFLERGEALEQAGRLDEAMTEFKRAVRADPGLAEAHMALGFHYRRKSLLSKAAEEFRSATSLAPSYDSYFNLGHVLVDLGRPQEAIAAFRQCLTFAPDDPAVGYEIGFALYSAADYRAALEQLRPLLAAHPEDWELHYLAGSSELALGHYAQAQAELERALSLQPAGDEGAGLEEALQVALRYQEFAAPDPQDLKSRLYAEHGAVCLGSSGDDGLRIPLFTRDRLSYRDLGRTLQRFHALRLRWHWRFAAVVAVDETSSPLARAAAHSLRAPLVEPHQAPPRGLTLLVWARVSVPELLSVVAERVRGHHISLVLVVDEAALEEVVPDLVGVVTDRPVRLPWEQTARLRTPAQAAREIVAALKSLPPDETLPAQVRYYARLHRRLRFFPQPAG